MDGGPTESNAPGVAAVATLDVRALQGAGVRPVLTATCPLRLLAFSTPEEREAIPLIHPAWSWQGSVACAPGAVDVVRTVDVAVPADAVPAGSDIADYFLVAIVPVNGRPIRFTVEP